MDFSGLAVSLHVQLVFDMYFVMQIAKDGKYSSRAMRKVAEDSATKAIVFYTEETGGDPNRQVEHTVPVIPIGRLCLISVVSLDQP